MKPEDMKNLPKAPEGMSLFDALRVACIAIGKPINETDDDDDFDDYLDENGRPRCIAIGKPINETDDDDDFDDYLDENGRPRYLLCDHIWDILSEAGHGCEIIVHKENPETLYYDDFASQIDNIHFMSHLSEMIDEGYTVTVNGTDIFDLY